jgi:hypothetical protein
MWIVYCTRCKELKGGEAIEYTYTEFAAKITADLHNLANPGHGAWVAAAEED